MSEMTFVILKFAGSGGAADALAALEEAGSRGIVEIVDAVVVERTRSGRTRMRQRGEVSPGRASALGGAAGLTLGVALGGPIALAALGAMGGGVGARLRDSGIDRAAIRRLMAGLSDEDSLLAVVVGSADWVELRHVMAGFDGEVLSADFTDEDASAIADVIRDAELAAAIAEETVASDQRYNLLLLTCDQHNARIPRPPGYELPQHDRLDSAGLVFRDFYVTTALCTPSRSVMYTGMHAPVNGMWENTNMAWIDDMDPSTQTIGHMLRRSGYYTAFKGKWHLSDTPSEAAEDSLEEYGFSDFQHFGEVWGDIHDGYRWDPEIASDTAEWLIEKAPEISETQPWFLAVNFCNPHDIMYFDSAPPGESQSETSALMAVKREPDDDLYRKRWETELPASFDDPLTGHPVAVRDAVRDTDLAFGSMPRDRVDMWHNYVNYYLNCLRDVDRHIGTVLDALDASGHMQNTIIVFTADHGDMLAAHGMRQKGISPFREQWNVPFVIIHPDHPGGRATEAVGSTIDIVPTLLALAGVTARQRQVLHPQVKGEDLSAAMHVPDAVGPRGNPSEPGKGCLMTYDTLSTIDLEFVAGVASALIDQGEAEGDAPTDDTGRIAQARELFGAIRRADFSQRHVLRGVFDGRYKFVRYFAINEHNTPETIDQLYSDNDVALYDLLEDPTELENLANRDRPDCDESLVAKMNAKLNDLIRDEIGSDPNLVERPLMTFVTSGIRASRE